MVAQLDRPGHQWRLKVKPGRGTLEVKKPPTLGLIQPILKQTTRFGGLIFTDNYDINPCMKA